MSIKTGIALTVLAATVVGTTAAARVWGQSEASPFTGSIGGPAEHALGLGRLEGFCRMAKIALDLTDAQDEQIKGILRAHHDDFRSVMERLHASHEAVSQAVRQETVDEALIRQRVQEANGALGDLAVLHARVHHEVAAVLTPEQRKKAEAFHDAFRSRRELFRKAIGEGLRRFFEARS
jgi:Spy/CpxP family protein refolding chaperone